MLQPKDKDWPNGYKNKIPKHLSTRDTSNLGIHTDLQWGAGKLWKILKEMGMPDNLTWLLWNLYAG